MPIISRRLGRLSFITPRFASIAAILAYFYHSQSGEEAPDASHFSLPHQRTHCLGLLLLMRYAASQQYHFLAAQPALPNSCRNADDYIDAMTTTIYYMAEPRRRRSPQSRRSRGTRDDFIRPLGFDGTHYFRMLMRNYSAARRQMLRKKFGRPQPRA